MAANIGWKTIILIGIIFILIVLASGSDSTGISFLNKKIIRFDTFDNTSSPIIIIHPLNQTVTVGEAAMFNAVATGTEPLSYQWQKNGFDISGATISSYTIPAATMSDDHSSFRVKVKNNLGSVLSDQATLTVRTPLIVILDDFGSPVLNASLWTIIDPVGDTTFTMFGTRTPKGSLEITIPAGTSHDVWKDGNFAPRIMQTINNSDFEAEVKFQSQMTSQYQMQGIIIQQDGEKYLRFDVFHNGTTTRIFAAIFAGGIPTIIYDTAISPGNSLYMRINRNGDEWNQFYSYDGTTWIAAANFKYPLIVSSVGPFAGNAGENPAFTCKIDYVLISVFPMAAADSKFNVSGFKINAVEGTGIQNWTISIKNSTIQRKKVTDVNGFYEFTGLLNGTYTVTEELRPGWKNITAVSQEIMVTGQNITNLNFINTMVPRSPGVVSDDFNAPAMNTSLWTKIDPQKDSIFTIENEGTSNSLLNIIIPADTSHDVWVGNNASRIMQSVSDTDFEVEVKFQSLLNMKYQMQGIIVEQDGNNFIRFDFYSDGQKIWIFAADFINGSPSMKINDIIGEVPINAIPLYMRVKRAGNKWDQMYSFDGVNWNTSVSFDRIFTMTSVGPFAANAGSNPAFTSQVDYFINTFSPVVP